MYNGVWTDGESPTFCESSTLWTVYRSQLASFFFKLICLFWRAVCEVQYVMGLLVEAAEVGGISWHSDCNFCWFRIVVHACVPNGRVSHRGRFQYENLSEKSLFYCDILRVLPSLQLNAQYHVFLLLLNGRIVFWIRSSLRRHSPLNFGWRIYAA